MYMFKWFLNKIIKLVHKFMNEFSVIIREKNNLLQFKIKLLLSF